MDAAQSPGQAARRPAAVETQLEEAKRLYLEGRAHKRISMRHQRWAKSTMQRFQEFCDKLEAMGITVVIEPPSQVELQKIEQRVNNRATHAPRSASDRRSNPDR